MFTNTLITLVIKLKPESLDLSHLKQDKRLSASSASEMDRNHRLEEKNKEERGQKLCTQHGGSLVSKQKK